MDFTSDRDPYRYDLNPFTHVPVRTYEDELHDEIDQLRGQVIELKAMLKMVQIMQDRISDCIDGI